MGKKYIRVDDRLIHGQIITQWTKYLNINVIIVIDDKTAKNSVLKKNMSMSVPQNYKTIICSIDEAKEIIEKYDNTNSNVLVIVRFPEMLNKIASYGTKPEIINIGNVSKKDGSVFEVTHNVFLTKTDIEVIEELFKNNYKITFQLVPDTSKITWKTEREKFI